MMNCSIGANTHPSTQLLPRISFSGIGAFFWDFTNVLSLYVSYFCHPLAQVLTLGFSPVPSALILFLQLWDSFVMVCWPGLHVPFFLFDVLHQFVIMAIASLVTFVQLTEKKSAVSYGDWYRLHQFF